MDSQEFAIDRYDTYSRLRILRENLDTVLAPRLKSELVVLSGSGVKSLVLDLSECKYCDSSGLSAILVGNRLCRNAGGKFILTGLSPAVERLITISQLDTVLLLAYSESQIEEFLRQ